MRRVQDIYEDSKTVVRCVVEDADGFRVGLRLDQGLALSAFVFALVMDRLTDELRQYLCLL